MNEEETERILEIMATADGGCAHCAKELFDRFAREFPRFKELADRVFERKFGKEPKI